MASRTTTGAAWKPAAPPLPAASTPRFARFGKPRHTTIHVETSGIAAAQAALNNLKLPHDMLNFEHLRSGVGGIAAGLGLSEVSKLADTWTQAGNRIAAADVEARKVPIVLNEVADIAHRSRTKS